MAAPLRHAARAPYTHPYDVQFTARYGWTKAITILDDPRVFKLLPQFAAWTRPTHYKEAIFALRTSVTLERAYCAVAVDALATYGDHGSLISSIVRDHFPIEVKDMLRSLTLRYSREERRSLAHWQASGRRLATWRNERTRLQKESR